MNLEAFLNYFTRHIESIIQWLFLAILALTGILISRGLFAKKEEAAIGGPVAAGVGPIPELEGALKQILDRTQKLETVTVQGGLSPEAAALAETQVQNLKKELAARDEELKALKASGANSKVTEEANQLTLRLKELESKLAEYEILEDDIADLSLYKEENTRLRSELNKLKGVAAEPAPEPVPAVVSASEPSVAPAPPPPEPSGAKSAAMAAAPGSAAAAAAMDSRAAEDIVAEFAQAVSTDPIVAPNKPGNTEVTMQVPDTGNPMKDFEAAVAIEKKEKAAAAAPAAKAAAPAAKSKGKGDEAEDLFAEFSEPPANTDENALDTDKMMAEMAALVSLEPASGSALEDGIDTEKMAAEAGTFGKR